MPSWALSSAILAAAEMISAPSVLHQSPVPVSGAKRPSAQACQAPGRRRDDVDQGKRNVAHSRFARSPPHRFIGRG